MMNGNAHEDAKHALKGSLRIAVTGGSGQLGTLLLRRLASDRAVQSIVSLDLRPPAVASAKLTAITADVRDPDLERHFVGCDAVVHLAFIVTAFASREQMQAINVEGSKNVFRAAAAAGAAHIVYTSSVAAYGIVPGHPVPIVEDTPRRHQPGFNYSANKFEVEAFLDEFEPAHPTVPICRIRPVILVGDRMDHSLGDAVRRGRMPDSGGPPLPFVWDEDVADFVVLALKQRAHGAYNLVADDPISTDEFAAGAGLEPLRIPRKLAVRVARVSPWLAKAGLLRAVDPAWVDHDAGPIVVSSAKARALGWRPRFPTTTDVARRLGQTPRAVDRRIALFMRMAAYSAPRMPVMPEAQRVNALVHVELTGRSGGDYTIEIENGKPSIRPGVARPPTSVVTLRASTFLDLLSGKLSMATAQLTGKIRLEGEPVATMILSALATAFRVQREQPGARGWPARRLTQWFEAP